VIHFDANGNAAFAASAIVAEGFEKNASTAAQDGLVFVEGDDALEGHGWARVDTQQNVVTFPLPLRRADGSYRATFFARSNRVVADVQVEYPDDGGSPSFSARFFPTGRVTSDGWYEVATSSFSVEGARRPKLDVTMFASGADVDALEVVPEGNFHRPNTCAVDNDARCEVGEMCAAGWCRDGATNVPPLPAAEYKDGVVTYLEDRFRLFFGGRYTRQTTLPRAIAALEGMRSATDPWTFWNGFATGLHRLRDWHTTMNGSVGVNGRGAFPICVVEGDGDLSHDTAPKHPSLPDVIVSHVGPTQSSGLKPGDRIVAINGMHPIEFADSLDDVDWGFWHADDPDVHAEAMERLRMLIRRWANTITWIKCDPVAGTCAPPETVSVSDLPTTEPEIYPECDHRPKYHLASGNPDPITHRNGAVLHGRLEGSPPGEDFYGMIWESVYTDGSSNAYEASIEEFRAKAKGVILDHRTGNGGTEPAAEYLTTLFRTPMKLGASTGYHQTVGLFDTPSTEVAEGLASFDLHKLGGDAYDVGAPNARTDLKTALLLARDGSASDWFPFGMVGLTNVRVFGRRTAGAFSSYLQFDYFGQINWRLASGDLVRTDGTTHLGEGVLPAEEIVPKQSDLLAGKDTVYERALTWLRTP
jgi:hypothetical protein